MPRRATPSCRRSSSSSWTNGSTGSSRSAQRSPHARRRIRARTAGAFRPTRSWLRCCVARATSGSASRSTSSDEEPVVLATGGFGAALARRLSLPLRASPWSEGTDSPLARRSGAAPRAGMDEFYGRALPAAPARVREARLRSAGAGVRPPRPRVRRDGLRGREREPRLARERPRPGDRAEAGGSRVVPRRRGDARTRRWETRPSASGSKPPARREGRSSRPDELPFPVPSGYVLAVHVTASVTHTIGGVAVDREGACARRRRHADRRPLRGGRRRRRRRHGRLCERPRGRARPRAASPRSRSRARGARAGARAPAASASCRGGTAAPCGQPRRARGHASR